MIEILEKESKDHRVDVWESNDQVSLLAINGRLTGVLGWSLRVGE